MMINHHEIEHILTGMADVIRNAAYKVATERRDAGITGYAEMFDETGTLIAYDEMSIKALLKDSLENYLQFSAGMLNPGGIDFNYYLGDSFKLIEEHVQQNSYILTFLSTQFAMACADLAALLAPVIEDLSLTGQSIDKVESYTINTEESYYLVYGESPDHAETYDPKEDDLSTVDTYQSPQELAQLEQRRAMKAQLNQVNATFTPDGQLYVNPDSISPKDGPTSLHMGLVAPIPEHWHNASLPPAIFPEYGLK